MESFGEYFESITGPYVSATTSTGPLVLGMGSGEEPMDDAGSSDERGNYSDGVMWMGSQASSVLGHLMTSGTKGKEEGNGLSLGVAGDLPTPVCGSSSTPFPYDEPYTSSATTTGTRARALAPSTRRNISSSTASSSTAPPTSHPAFEVFPLIVKQATSQVDENLKQKTSTLKQKTPLSRTNSANRLTLGNTSHDSRASTIQKPRRHSPMLATRPRDRVMSDGDVHAVGGREHRVGGDVKGKGRGRDGYSYSRNDSSTRVGDGDAGGGDVESGKVTGPEAVEREAKRRRDMPPPALPPERVASHSTSSSATSRQSTAKAHTTPATMADPRQHSNPPFNTRPPVQHTYSNSQSVQQQSFPQASQQQAFPQTSQYQSQPPVQPGHAIAAANAQRRASESHRPLPPPQTRSHVAPPTTYAPRSSQMHAPAEPTSAAPTRVPSSVGAPQAPRPSQTTTPSSQSNPPSSQTKPPAPQPQPQAQPVAPPRPSQPPRHPVPLGMRRASTFSSSSSQRTYAPFEFASQSPSSSFGSSNSSFASGQGSRPLQGSKSSGGLGSAPGGPAGSKAGNGQGTGYSNSNSNSNSNRAYEGGGGAMGQGQGQPTKPIQTYAVSGELPTKQKPFRPPLKQRTKSTLALFEGYDFTTGERVKAPAGASTSAPPPGVTVNSKGGGRAAGTGTATSMLASNPVFTPASRAQVIQRSGSGGTGGSTTPYSNSNPECLSASTSSTSSLTLSSGGRTPPLTTGDSDTSPPVRGGGRGMGMSPVTPVTTSTVVIGSGVAMGRMKGKEEREEEDQLVLSSDPSDDSFGDFGWDDGELAQAGMAFD